MTLKDQLHSSKTHRIGIDFNCPKCIGDESISDVLEAVIKDLGRCADQNEKDAKHSGSLCTREFAKVTALAGEQRRMIGILKMIKKWTPTEVTSAT